jgi:hypothetical protein
VCALLYHVGIEIILVVDNDIVGWPNVPLQAGMRLEVEVEQEWGREASVLHCARKSISVVRFLLGRRWVESTVMSLSTNDDSDLWAHTSRPPPIFLKASLHFLESELFFEYILVLTLSPRINRLISLVKAQSHIPR